MFTNNTIDGNNYHNNLHNVQQPNASINNLIEVLLLNSTSSSDVTTSFSSVTAQKTNDSNDYHFKTNNVFEVVMYVMYTIIWLAAILGNGFIIYIVFRYKRMQTVTNLFILNLAVGDILMAALCIPFTFVSNLLLQYWPFGPFMCVVVCYSQAVTVFVSAYTLIAISIDR
ncbi:unnamed protein product [Medioppia subpectinata]|uniref:G-protein coupled receptors family 1 profile domain-containing protein n=1 Tax=Medioppia subpectinata TaxID=1979941 RepID=A0A7R9Q750_9ACAR|nr:unnamed protein product [Medioppia subpectinata]CAG2115351.1 unnamed protein product [Medioppia subpectinata]